MTTTTGQTNTQWFASKYLTGATTKLDCNFEEYIRDMGFSLEFTDQVEIGEERLCLVNITDPDDKSECQALIYCNGGWAVADEVTKDDSLVDLTISWCKGNEYRNIPAIVLTTSVSAGATRY